MGTAILLAMIKVLVLMVIFLTATAWNTLYERRVAAKVQQRVGPNRAGPMGLLQPISDAVKLFFKEDIVTDKAERFMYWLAPIISICTALLFMAAIPFGPEIPGLADKVPPAWAKFSIIDLNVAVLFVLAVSSVAVYSVLLGGWAGNSKYSLLGGMRSGAQMISYEIAMGLSIMPVIMSAGSLSLHDIVVAQADTWNIFRLPWGIVGFFLFMIAIMAEANRAPFDLVEAEQELVGGYHTEYSSMKFGGFFVAEYGNLITISALIVTFYLGGWQGLPFVDLPLPAWLGPWLGLFLFAVKTMILVAVIVWIRWTFPRPRYDQMMALGWKVLFPVALGNLFVAGVLISVGQHYGIGYFG